MKKIGLYICIIVTSLTGWAQNPYQGEVSVVFDESEQTRDTVILEAKIDLSRLSIKTQEMITFTPVYCSLDGSEESRLMPIVVAGKKKAKSSLRSVYFAGNTGATLENMIVVDKNNLHQEITIHVPLPFEEWMLHSHLVITEQTTRCGNGFRKYGNGCDYKQYKSAAFIFPEPVQPVFTVLYVVPPEGEPKIMQEVHEARLNFEVNRTELLRQWGNNARILAEVDDIIEQVKKDPLLTIKRIYVRGYASPEGGAANNQRLSDARARAFLRYLHENHHFYGADGNITAEGMGEDWDGLRKALEQDVYFADRDRILDILNRIYEPERRKSAIKGLSGGRTYQRMLEQIYPSLRRNEYTIEYEVQGFNAEQSREIFRTRPQLLSLNEFFMVANLYEHQSDEFKQVFDVVARIFPDSPIAQLNVGAMEIENGSYDTAIKRLENLDMPEAYNNLGVAYWFKEDLEQADAFFQQAADAGSEQAQTNLDKLREWIRNTR